MNKKVLFVDDSATMRKVAEIAFLGTSYELTLASNASQALEKIKLFQPDVVLVDGGLPEGSGYELVAQGRSWIPQATWLLLTSSFHPVDEGCAQRVGIQHFLQKPFEIQGLLDKLQELSVPRAGAQPSIALHTQVGIPAVRLTPPVPPGMGGKEIPVAKSIGAQTIVFKETAPENGAVTREQPALPAMPRLPLLPRAPLPLPVVEALEQMARRGASYEALARLSADTIEKIAWEVIPELAEILIRERLRQSALSQQKETP